MAGYNLCIVMKRLRTVVISVLLWLIGGGAIGGIILFVASQQHRAAEKYEAEREKRCTSSFRLDPEKQDACKHERDTPGNYLPWGYVLVAWPDGIMGWAIIATGFVIAWQSYEMRRQAEHMGKQTLILRQSADIDKGATVPTLRMLKFKMSGSDPLVDNEMELTVRNYGATPAILDALYISFDDGERWPPAEGTPVAYDDGGGGAVAANSEVTLHCSPTICLVSPRLIPRFRTELKRLYAHGRLKYLDVFESPVRSLRFDVCLSPMQNGAIHCEIIGQWNEYETQQKAN
jgi:hypothetical protein